MKQMYKRMMRLASGVLACILMIASLGLMAKPVHAKDTLTGLSATEIVAKMGFGWNLGNTFDATGGRYSDPYSGEVSWGNPRVTKELIQAVHAGGFDTIRIPTTWNNYIVKDGTYKINPAYIARVKEVVNYAYEEGMFIILNVHHESWVNDRNLEKNYEKIGEQLAAVWYQIAENFAEFDQHLIFEGMNEPRKAGTDVEWGGNQEAYEAINYLDQVFVNAVRMSEKGYNAERCLMVPGYAASSSYGILNSITLPTYQGEVAKNLIVAVHSYAPYDFCLSDKMRNFDPNSSACVGEINSLYANLDELFLSKGIPVVMGETGVTAKNNVPEREKWAAYVGNIAAAYGVPIVLWDNGSNSNSGGESHAHMNRRTNEWNYPTVIKAMMDAKANVVWGSARKQAGQDKPSGTLGGTVIWEEASGRSPKKTWDATYIQFGAKESYFLKNGEIALVYTGSQPPRVVLDSEQKSVWWIVVDPSRTENKNGKKIAYFTYDDIIKAMKANKVDSPSQLRNFSVVAASNDTTMYEIEVLGGDAEVTYYVFGKRYASGIELPEEPTYTDMKFLGWYSTRDYKPESAYKGGAVTESTAVYAKFELTKDFMPQFEQAGLTKTEEDPTEEATTEEATTEEATTEEATTEETTTEEVITSAEETQEMTEETQAPTKEQAAATNTPEKEEPSSDTSSNNSIVIIAVVIVIVVILAVVAGVIVSKKKKK